MSAEPCNTVLMLSTCNWVRLRLRGHGASSVVIWIEGSPPTPPHQGGEIGRERQGRQESGGWSVGGRGHAGPDYREGLVM